MVGFKTQCREHRREKTRVKTFLTTCPSPPLPSVLLFKHRYYDDDDSAKTPSLSPLQSPSPLFFCDVASKVVMPRQWRNDPHRHRRSLFSGAGFKTDPISGRRARQRGSERRVWVFGRRRTKGEIGSDEAVVVVAAAVVNAYFLR